MVVLQHIISQGILECRNQELLQIRLEILLIRLWLRSWLHERKILFEWSVHCSEIIKFHFAHEINSFTVCELTILLFQIMFNFAFKGCFKLFQLHFHLTFGIHVVFVQVSSYTKRLKNNLKLFVFHYLRAFGCFSNCCFLFQGWSLKVRSCSCNQHALYSTCYHID